MNLIAQKRLTFPSMITKNSQLESIEINYMLISTKERRNSERKYFNPTITITTKITSEKV